MNKIWEKIQNKRLILASVLIGLAGTLFLTGLNTVQLKRENREIKARLQREIQQGIAGEVFRLHVIANSDTEEDQKLKLKIKTRKICRISGRRDPGQRRRLRGDEGSGTHPSGRNRKGSRKADS